MLEIRLPQYGMGMTDGTITVWRKAVGEHIAKGEILCDIEAAKTVVEMECPESGVLRRIVVPIDENVAVNTIIAELETSAVSAAAPARAAAPPTTAHTPAEPAAATTTNARRTESANTGAQIEPLARRSARELGVDLAQVSGSGPGGRITLKDVEAIAQRSSAAGAPPAEKPAPPPAPAEQPPAFTESVHSMTRRTIARRLTESKQQVPHFYVKASIAVDVLQAARRQHNEADGPHASLNDFVVRAVALTLATVPDMNVSWTDVAMRRHRHVDVAVAVATPRGLVTPIVRQAQDKSVRQIAVELKDLIERARAGKLKSDEYNGGTVSVSNMGMLGVEEFSAIINPPQSAIFAIGASEPRPIVRAGNIEIATMMTVTLSVDHRCVDGEVAAKGLAAFKRLIETPDRLLT